MATPQIAVQLQPTNKQFAAARTEFKEFSIGELKEFEQMFSKFDTGLCRCL
jgi:hypothetical protein